MTPDVNVLLAAYRTDHPRHPVARPWLESSLAAADSGARWTLLPMVAAGFLRLVTHPKVFPEPTPTEQACTFVDALLSCPGVEMGQIGQEWNGLAALSRDRGLSGNRVPDAWIASAVRTLGEHLVTFDRDFSALLDRSEFTLLKGHS